MTTENRRRLLELVAIYPHVPSVSGHVNRMKMRELEANTEGCEDLDEAALLELEATRLTTRFTAALVDGDKRTAWEIYREALKDLGSATLVNTQVVQPAMYVVGDLWQRGQISVAREHIATGVCQYVVVRAFCVSKPAQPNGRRALFACVSGNQHSLGLRIVSDAFEMDGWTVRTAGSDCPTDELCAEVADWRPNLVGLSVSMPWQLPTLEKTLSRLRAHRGSQQPYIMLGGFLVNNTPAIAGKLGADVFAKNACDAVEAARSTL